MFFGKHLTLSDRAPRINWRRIKLKQTPERESVTRRGDYFHGAAE
jgi:hypothetical protein